MLITIDSANREVSGELLLYENTDKSNIIISCFLMWAKILTALIT